MKEQNKSERFKQQLKRCVGIAIANQPRHVVGIGDECLWGAVASLISRNCPDAPLGTNCAYVAKQEYLAIVREAPFNKFVYDQKADEAKGAR